MEINTISKKKRYRQQYYLTHKETEKENQKKHYWKDPEESRDIAKKYRINNPEKIKEIKRKTRLKNKDNIKKLYRDYYQTNRLVLIEKAKLRNKKRLYNISPIEFKILSEENKCGICETLFNGKRPFIPCIDHCHKSKVIRGLLCFKCNSALGFFNEDIYLIKKAIEWLNRVTKKPHLVKKYIKKDFQTKKEYQKEYLLILKYGISFKEKEKMLKAQNNRCGICSIEFTNKYPLIPCIDHCHQTNEIRGILCKKCNLGLGLFKDSIENLENSLLWLNKGEKKYA